MRTIKTLLIILWKLWFLLLNALSLLFVVPTCMFFIAINRYKAFYLTERLWAWFVFYTSGFYFIKEFPAEKLTPNKPYIIISNHTSMLDILIMFILHRDNPLVFVGKSEVKNYPLLGYVFKKAHILVDRKDKESRKKVYDAVQEKINQGLSVCIFPEGGVPDESIDLKPFKDGAFGMAITHQIPILPYTLGNVKEHLPFALLKGKPGGIKIKQHAVIETNGLTKKDTNHIKKQAYLMILKQLEKFKKDS